MGIYKRPGSKYWQYKFEFKGRPIQASARTEDEGDAAQAEAKHLRELWEEDRLGVKPSKLWETAVADYLGEMAEGRNKENTKAFLTWAGGPDNDRQPWHLRGKAVAAIDRALLVLVRDAKAAEINADKAAAAARGNVSRWEAAQPSTVNRYLGIVGAVLHHAEIEITMPNLPLEKKDKPFATREQIVTLMKHLPKHQIPLVLFDLEVGWRRSNVTHLQWPQVNIEQRFAYVKSEDAKNKDGIPTPLSDTAVMILQGQLGKHSLWVFPYSGRGVSKRKYPHGKPIDQTSTKAFRKAVRAAGLPDNFTWHAFRHTWASWHAQDGTLIGELMELGGWKDARMVKNYSHLGAKHLHRIVNGRTALAAGAAAAALATMAKKGAVSSTLSGTGASEDFKKMI